MVSLDDAGLETREVFARRSASLRGGSTVSLQVGLLHVFSVLT
jgi:hypothetical protein